MTHGRVLIVDDPAEERGQLARQFTRNGFEVTCADRPDEALDVLKGQEIDLALIALKVQGDGGLDLIRRIRAEPMVADLPVLVMVAQSDRRGAVQGLQNGAQDYITTPVDFPIALSRVTQQIDHRTALRRLRHSEDRLALAAAGSNDGIWDYDLIAGTFFVSDRWLEILGLTGRPNDQDPEIWFDRIHDDDKADLQTKLRALMIGAEPELVADFRMRHNDGGFRWVRARGVARRDEDGDAIRIAGSLADITRERMTDSLTRLPNRSATVELFERVLKRATRTKDTHLVATLTIDQLRQVQEGLGQAKAQELSRIIADRLARAVRPTDIIGSFGGTEFYVMLTNVTSIADGLRGMQRITDAISEPVRLADITILPTVSAGVVLTAAHTRGAEQVLQQCHAALSQAGTGAGDHIRIFNATMEVQARDSLARETDIREAAKSHAFRFHYQPIVDAVDGGIVGFESLIRWQKPDGTLVSPLTFVDYLERSGLIQPVTLELLRGALNFSKVLNERLKGRSPVVLSVNISAVQVRSPTLVSDISACLQDADVPPDRLKVEITESAMIADFDTIKGRLDALSNLGLKLSIDDFGTGYSSLSYLALLPFDELKIDRSFVSNVHNDAHKRKLFEVIMTLADRLGLSTVVEGVESREELNEVLRLHARFVQGFYYSKPLSADDILAQLDRDPNWLSAPTLPAGDNTIRLAR
jgi:diguanylate cyclase (GGDEF)-like protein/PAS domain S-box-containing protein